MYISSSKLVESKRYFEKISNCIFKFLFRCFRKLGFQQIFHYHPTFLYRMQVQCFCFLFVFCFKKYIILTTLYLFLCFLQLLLSFFVVSPFHYNYPVEISHQINLSFLTVDKWKILSLCEIMKNNPLGPKSDQHHFSSNSISRSSRVKVMWMTKLITKRRMP